jgi:hypothetical protein
MSRVGKTGLVSGFGQGACMSREQERCEEAAPEEIAVKGDSHLFSKKVTQTTRRKGDLGSKMSKRRGLRGERHALKMNQESLNPAILFCKGNVSWWQKLV